ncbi:hypothetical protein [Peribacillus deserti]|uniref:SbsC C-terminal domain-containing protein n=1 Tax=Peribacillus deserti TaxID=673318 RepID=A0A2N5MBM0_9BACI|nr:hypothetical protein [Peribacillus deserti]PLT31760.1 hypothetical protein CUU66_00940 [Peribacillus deserti]
MSKKKAIKLATATAIAASAFAAVAPVQSEAATKKLTLNDVVFGAESTIVAPYKEMVKTKPGYVASGAKVADLYKKSIAKYNEAVAWVNKNASAKYKPGALAKLKSYKAYADRTVNYPAAIKATQDFQRGISAAIKNPTDDGLEKALADLKDPKNSGHLAIAKVYGTTVRAGLTQGFGNGNTKLTAQVEAAIANLPAKVRSVSAINGKQLVVKFNKPVDETTAELIGNYSFSDGNSVVANGAELQEDGKSVKLTLTSAYDNTKTHSVAVTVEDVKVDGTVDTTFPIFTSVVSISDTAKAEVSGVTAVTNTNSVTSVTVDFSEPIASGAAFKVNGSSVNAVYNAGDTSATLSVPAGLAVGSTHKVEVVNLTDLSGNVNAVASKDFTVTKDVNLPVVSSIVAQGDNQLLVTFSKNMKNDAAAQANLATNLKVKNDVYGDVRVTSVTPVNRTSKTQFVVQLNTTDAASLYSTTKTSHNLTALFVDNTIEDYLGNKLAGTTRTLTISKDSVSPEVTGVSYKKNSAGKVTSVVVNFSEGVKANAALAFPATLVNENGVIVNTSDVLSTIGTANVAKGDKSAEFTLSTPQTVSGKYSVGFATAWVEDNSLAENDSKAYTTTVDFGASQAAGDYTIAAGSVTNSGTNVIRVVFPEAVKGGAVAGSATDASRYTINGRALPAGTTITLNAASQNAAAQTIATITLPAQSVETSDNAAIFTINGVQTLTGKTNKSFTKALVITDNVSPVLQNARVLDNKTIELTYSEALDALNAASVGSEFTIYQGTTALTLTDAELTASSVSGFGTKVRLTVSKDTPVAAVPATATKSGAAAAKVTVTDGDKATKAAVYNYTIANGTGTNDGKLVVKTGTTEVVALDANGDATFTVDGVTVAVDGAVLNDAFTLTTTAPVAATSTATTLDLSKDLSIETGTAVDVDDVAHNLQKANVKVNVSK